MQTIDEQEVPPKKKRSKRYRIGCMAFSVLILGILIVCYCPIWPEKPFRSAEFEKVVALVKSGVYKPDAKGIVILPDKLQYLTFTGRVYVSRGEHGSTVIFFPSWVGRSTICEPLIDDIEPTGYLYDSGKENLTNKPGVDIPDGWTVNAPSSERWNPSHDNRVYESNLLANYQVKPHWFHVQPFS